MIKGEVEKQPAETFLIGIDFADELATGETIIGQTVTSKNAATGAGTSSTFLTGSPVLTGSILAHRVVAGVDGEQHLVQFRINTIQANTYEAEVKVSVVEY